MWNGNADAVRARYRYSRAVLRREVERVLVTGEVNEIGITVLYQARELAAMRLREGVGLDAVVQSGELGQNVPFPTGLRSSWPNGSSRGGKGKQRAPVKTGGV